MVTQVDKLEIYVVVDNCVEWISTLPPGFSHELPQHLMRPPPHAAPVHPVTGTKMLDFKNYCCGAHGLSLLLVTTIGNRKYHVMMDAGPEQLSIERNMAALKTPMEKLDALVLSHWHSDHSGGILKVLQLRHSKHPSLPPLKVDLHPGRPYLRGMKRPQDPKPFAALPPDPTYEEITQHHGIPDLHSETHEIISIDGESTGVIVSGEIPRVVKFEKGVIGGVSWDEEEGDWFTDELIKDERYVVVDVKGKGLCVFSSCSHAGICNVLTDAMNTYHRPIHLVAGGFHLVPIEFQPVDQTVEFISQKIKPTPNWVLPLHCTGLEPRGRLKAALGERCIPAGVGMRVEVQGDEKGENALEGVDLSIGH